MRNIRWVLAVACGLLITQQLDGQTFQINRDNKTIAISANDEATATADIAAISVGFEIYGPDAEAAYAHAGALSNSILGALRAAGVSDKDIESSEQNLQRNTDFDDKDSTETRAQKKFLFKQSWLVSVSPAAASDVIRLAVAAGANKVGEIKWRLADRKSLQAKAAESAQSKLEPWLRVWPTDFR